MQHLRQLILHDPDNGKIGDCWRTCIAMVLGLQQEEVPNFAEHGPYSYGKTLAWLQERGLTLVRLAPYHEKQWFSDDLAVIASGVSPRGIRHSVVHTGDRTYDPHPSDEGLETVDALNVIAVLPPRGGSS